MNLKLSVILSGALLLLGFDGPGNSIQSVPTLVHIIDYEVKHGWDKSMSAAAMPQGFYDSYAEASAKMWFMYTLTASGENSRFEYKGIGARSDTKGAHLRYNPINYYREGSKLFLKAGICIERSPCAAEIAFKSSDWQLLNTSGPVILGHKTLSAVLCSDDFYTAYFAPTLPISQGPMGYSGLPGLILQLSSKDRVIKAVSIAFKSNVGDIASYRTENCSKILAGKRALQSWMDEHQNCQTP